ncbi:MAG: ATP-dependent protease ATPase subunit HslU [bacterium]|jgi:ATP-dependent HslUV protease ATP-binding subunit HslU
MRNSLEKNGGMFEDLTPRQIVERLDDYIVGQDKAKRAVAVAIRNRWRRARVPAEFRDEIIPKNILMIGPTGVGKTEIARRLALIIKAPFIKVEASKFTEVGYVGRDVESIVRDLIEIGVRMVRNERICDVTENVKERVNERLLDKISPRPRHRRAETPEEQERIDEEVLQANRIRERVLADIRSGKKDDEEIDIETRDSRPKMMQVFSSAGLEEMGMNIQDLMGEIAGPGPKKRKRIKIGEAKRILFAEEVDKVIDMDAVITEAVDRVEQAGIVFVDEIDKIAGSKPQHGPDVSREGVQRDILPLVEGTTVITKYGPIRTHHILFIAAGAFHMSKPSDLIPEFQGRFPIRVELTSLSAEDFRRILTEPTNALTKQYAELLSADGVTVEFTDDGIESLADHAEQINKETENIGARRLHTILEYVLEDISFAAPLNGVTETKPLRTQKPEGGGLPDALREALKFENGRAKLVVDKSFVESRLKEVIKDKDLASYIL